jgi:hypothetical protein
MPADGDFEARLMTVLPDRTPALFFFSIYLAANAKFISRMPGIHPFFVAKTALFPIALNT